MFLRSLNSAKLSIFISVTFEFSLLLGCAGQSSSPANAMGANEVAQVDDLERIESQWAVGSRSQRIALKSELEKFLAASSQEELTARVRVLLAWVLIEEGHLEGARAELAQLENPKGRLHDQRELLLGKIARREGDPDESLEHLLPLRGKLLTDEARQTHSIELVQSAIAARRYRLAVEAMVVRVQQAQTREDKVEAIVLQDMQSIPVHALLRIIEEFYGAEQKDSPGPAEKARAALLEVIVNQLAERATVQGDNRLARDLLEAAPAWLRAGIYGDKLSSLSQLVTEEAKIRGLTIGVVLGGADPNDTQTQARSIQVALGLSRGLGSVKGSPIDLVFAENRGSLSAALGVLSGLGASILITGVQREQSTQAINYANKNQVPIIVLTPPAAEMPLGEFGFSLGVSEAEQLSFVQSLFAQQSTRSETMRLRSISSTEVCLKPMEREAAILSLLDSLKPRSNDQLSFFGSVSCARALLRGLQQRENSSAIILGLEASSLRTRRARVMRIKAGRWQPKVKPPQFVYSDEETKPFRGDSKWYAALGVDAARLASAALGNMPLEESDSPALVKQRYRQTRDGLMKVKVELLTTDSKGFDAEHRVSYTLSLSPPLQLNDTAMSH